MTNFIINTVPVYSNFNLKILIIYCYNLLLFFLLDINCMTKNLTFINNIFFDEFNHFISLYIIYIYMSINI